MLLPIWQRVLQRTSIRVTDNFFDLGGTSSSVTQLFAEIADELGRDFPAVTICAAPTIETLAGLLEETTPPRIRPLLLLKAGSENPPVFITHGLGGDVLGLVELVGKIGSRRPIYGMQARGIDGIDEPLASIEERAQFYLDAIQQLQPHGPYSLIGYSLGGLVTLEMAQRLSAAGETIALLTLLDTYPDKKYLSLVQSTLLTFRQAKRRMQNGIGLALSRKRSQSPEIGDKIQRYLQSASIAGVAQRMKDADYAASRGYCPRFYRGKVKFVRAEIATYFPHNPTAVWADLIQEFALETTPGDHVGMLTTRHSDLSALLSRYLDEANAALVTP
ncbi:MAG: thioesterase domain-containing protein [Candidatus Sulfotelmatobacter sp.]